MYQLKINAIEKNKAEKEDRQFLGETKLPFIQVDEGRLF